MNVNVKSAALSSLNPIEISYYYNNNEKLNGSYLLYNNGVRTYNYELFKNFKDTAISKKTAVVLTDVKDLKNVFKNSAKNINVGYISGNCYLETQNNATLKGDTFIKLYNNDLWIGGKGDKAVFTIIPISSNIVELKIKDLYVQVSEDYPYEVVLSNSTLPNNQRYRQRFFLEYTKDYITFKHQTKLQTYRFLSYSLSDRKLKCIGLQLNNTVINQYYFKPTFVSSTSLKYGYIPTTQEIKYFNQVSDGKKQNTVEIANNVQSNTNLLVTLPTTKLLENSASANIAILKTNFAASGAYDNIL